MSLGQIGMADLIGTLLGIMLTLFVFSYIFGDNVLFRVAIYLFIGVASGYAAVIAWYNVIWPQLLRPLVFGSQPERLFALFPLVLSGMLLLKISPRYTRLGNPALAFLVGIGVATAIGGAVLGTIFPQVGASVNLFDAEGVAPGENVFAELIKGGLILFGTLVTLIYFHFGTRKSQTNIPKRPEWIEWLALIGQLFIAITFGALFAGVFSAALTALIERLFFITDFLFSLF
jgi:hypothetical protein